MLYTRTIESIFLYVLRPRHSYARLQHSRHPPRDLRRIHPLGNHASDRLFTCSERSAFIWRGTMGCDRVGVRLPNRICFDVGNCGEDLRTRDAAYEDSPDNEFDGYGWQLCQHTFHVSASWTPLVSYPRIRW